MRKQELHGTSSMVMELQPMRMNTMPGLLTKPSHGTVDKSIFPTLSTILKVIPQMILLITKLKILEHLMPLDSLC